MGDDGLSKGYSPLTDFEFRSLDNCIGSMRRKSFIKFGTLIPIRYPEAKHLAEHESRRRHEIPRGARTVAGVASGAVFGFAVGGSAGAMFGSIAGFIIGASSDVSSLIDEW